uniref:Ig-like domain-containing protein n=1 Tax=Esox lucius TaxID=8010 RepID=A0A6Q2XBV8_ESOLU
MLERTIIAPTFIKRLMDIQDVLGSSIYMECKFAGSLPISTQWMKDDHVLASKTKYLFEHKDNTVSLKIKTFEEEDTGEYLCKITNKAGSCVCIVPPSFVSEPEPQAVLPNATVHFRSVFHGTPPFTVRWFKDDVELITGPSCAVGLEDLSCFLDLYSVGFLQGGTYSCQVSNDAGTQPIGLLPFSFNSLSLNIFLFFSNDNLICFDFTEPPEFVQKMPPTAFVKQSESLRLECKVTEVASLQIQWYKNETKVTHGDNYRTSFVDSVAVLELLSTTTADDGVYTCEAQNDAGAVSCSTILTVQDPPSFVKVPKPLEEIKGKDVMLYCELYGTAPFEIFWYKDKKALKESRKYKMVNESTSATLHILALDPSDVGDYECKVMNKVGCETCHTTVSLKEPPMFVKKLVNQSVKLGEEVTLMATVKGSQPMTVSWVQDKDKILRDGDNRKITFENNMVTLKVFKADNTTGGTYTCQLKNDCGVVQCVAVLTVLGL